MLQATKVGATTASALHNDADKEDTPAAGEHAELRRSPTSTRAALTSSGSVLLRRAQLSILVALRAAC